MISFERRLLVAMSISTVDGGSNVGYGVHGLLLDLLVEVLHGGIFERVVARALGILMQIVQFLMGNREICFKIRPGLIGWVGAAPHFEVVSKHAGFEYKFVGGGEHLLLQIRIFGGCCNVHGVVNLINEYLHRLINVVIGAHPLVIALKTPIRNVCISKVKVRQHLLGGVVGVSNVLVLEVSNVGFVDGKNEKGIEGLVLHVLLGIKGLVDVILPASVCDLCCHQALRNDGIRDRIVRWNKDDVGFGIVDGTGDGYK